MIEIEGHLINKNTIAYVKKITDRYVYGWIATYYIIIYFVGGSNLELKTHEKNEFETWWKELGK